MKWLVFLVAVILSAGTKAQERVVSFHSDIRIAADGWLTVTERIDINVEGRQVQRGILRDFPTDYRDRFGNAVSVPFVVESVTRDGAPEPYSENRKANGASLRIGNPQRLLEKRRHVYEIRYRTRFQVGFFDKHDELYWNVNGNGWTFAMEQVSAAVTLPRQVLADELKAEAYTGAFGAKGRDYSAATRNGGAEFASTRRLAAGEGLTIVLAFPKRVVLPPTLGEKLGRWSDDNPGLGFGVAGVLALLAFLSVTWLFVGMDPRAGPRYPHYEAPAGFGPAAVRYLDRMAWDDRCFTAALLGLAQRGYLTIHQEEKYRFLLQRTGKEVDFMPGDAAVAALVPEKGAVSFSYHYSQAVGMATHGLKTALAAQLDKGMFAHNGWAVGVGVVIGLITVVVMSMMQAAVPWIFAAALLMIGMLVAAVKLMPAYTREGRKRMDEIEGLRQYLTFAEADDLARQKEPPRTPGQFAKFLPYAFALGVEKTWAEVFTATLGAAAVAAAASEFYSSSLTEGTGFRVEHLAESLGTMDQSISQASSPPGESSGSSGGGGSSSGGGGGSSGGGGGGGGGSGW